MKGSAAAAESPSWGVVVLFSTPRFPAVGVGGSVDSDGGDLELEHPGSLAITRPGERGPYSQKPVRGRALNPCGLKPLSFGGHLFLQHDPAHPDQYRQEASFLPQTTARSLLGKVLRSWVRLTHLPPQPAPAAS